MLIGWIILKTIYLTKLEILFSSDLNEINFRNIVFWQIDELWLSWSNLNSCWLLLLLYSLFLNFPIHYFWLNYLPLDWFRATITSSDVLNLTLLKTIFIMWKNQNLKIRPFHTFHNHHITIIYNSKNKKS